MSHTITIDGEVQPPSGNPNAGQGGGSGPGANPNVDLSNITSTGGLSGDTGGVVVFGKTPFNSFAIGWKFDCEDFNCEEDCQYDFRIEEIEVYRQPTVNKVIIRYRDLGKCSLTCYFLGNVLGDRVSSKFVTVVFGGKADKNIYTTTFDLTCTFEAPQLIITRNASSGPLSITKVLVEMEHGDTKPQ